VMLLTAGFSVPVAYEDHAKKVCFAVLEKQKKFAMLREKWKAGGRPQLRAAPVTATVCQKFNY